MHGQVLATLDAANREFSDIPGGFLLISENELNARSGATKLRVGSAELALPTL